MRAKGPQILNADIKRYSDVGAGGFYLFVTRNRPLIYFAPTPSDNSLGKGCTPYLARWQQDGAIVNFANPFWWTRHRGTEALLPIDVGSDWQYSELKYFDSLKDQFSFLEFPASDEDAAL